MTRRGPSPGLALALLAALGCSQEEPSPCMEIECAGGFDLWITSRSETEEFVSGAYRVLAEIDDGEWEVRCSVDANGNDCSGGGRWLEQPTEDLSVEVSFGLPVSQAVIEDPALQIHVEGRSEASAGTNLFGPRSIEVTVFRGGRTAAVQNYSPSYERDEEFFGPAECGFCDSRELEIIRIPPP